jgi:hypothetical protein
LVRSIDSNPLVQIFGTQLDKNRLMSCILPTTTARTCVY